MALVCDVLDQEAGAMAAAWEETKGLRRHVRRAIIIAESLSRAIAVIRIASVRWRSYISPPNGQTSPPHPQNTEISPHRPCVRCAVIQIARLAFIRLNFSPGGTAEWLARVDRIRPTFFCASFFPFLPCPPHPSPGNFLFQNPLFLGPQIYSF